MALTTTEQKYFDHAKQALPRFLFQLDAAPSDILGAYAVMTGALDTQINAWLQQTFVKTSTGIFLDQHARDRGTTRREDETDETLAARLAVLEEVIIPSALIAHVNAILAAGGYPEEAAMVEMRRDKAYMADDGAGNSMAFLSRGYRMSSVGRPYGFIVMLPYDTDAVTATAVDEYLRQAKAAGFYHRVERRTSPP